MLRFGLSKSRTHVCGLSDLVSASAGGEDAASAGGEDGASDGGEGDASLAGEDVVSEGGEDDASAGGDGDFSSGAAVSRGGRSGMSWSIQPTTWMPVCPMAPLTTVESIRKGPNWIDCSKLVMSAGVHGPLIERFFKAMKPVGSAGTP